MAALTDTLTDIRTIDRDIRHELAEMAKHERCLRRCQAWRDHQAELDTLFDLRLRFMDRRDAAQLEGRHP